MKIFYLTDLLSPYRTAWMNLISEKHDVDAFYFDGTEKTREEKWLKSIKNNFKKHKAKSHTVFGVRFSREIFNILQNNIYDLYIVDGYASFVQVKAIIKLAKEGKNVFVNVDGIDIWRKEGVLLKSKWLVKSRLYNSGAKFLCGSKIAVEKILSFGAKPENVFKHPFTTIYASDIVSFDDKIKLQKKYKKEINAEGKKVAVAVGRFIPLKHYEDLIGAWQGAGDDCVLYLIGSGELKNNYQSLIDRLGIKNLIIVDHLNREELDKYYLAADLFIHTSSTEVWGLVFNEAMSKGCPVISTNHCVGAVELIENGKNGYLINVGDIENLRKKILSVLSNDTLRLDMMKSSINCIKEYTYENLAKTHIKIFEASLQNISVAHSDKSPSIIKKYYFGIVQRLITAYYTLHKNQISVFMFHDVDDRVSDNDHLNIKIGTFCDFIDGLDSKGALFAPASNIFRCGKKAIISFDDVYSSAVKNAIPYLNKKSIPYVLFVSPSLIDKPGYITSSQIKELSKNPLCTFGFHSADHIFMRSLGEEKIAYEIDCSRFEQEYNIKCDYFAYPYGSVLACSFKNMRMLKRSKYKAAFGTVNASTTDKLNKKHPFYIPRIAVGEKNCRKILSSYASSDSNCIRPAKKVLLINSVCGIGSTGRICTELAKQFSNEGADVKIAYGRSGYVPEDSKRYAVRIGNSASVKLHALKTRITDKHGLGSKFTTKHFLRWADKFDPDVLWLHNIHGYYINYDMLFKWIKMRPFMEVRWTLHDCWAFTGHCTHFKVANCSKWKTECENCPQTNEYPKCSFTDNSKTNYRIKRAAFTGVENLTVITPSNWLANLVKQSFLGEYPTEVQNNKIDFSVFKPTPSEFKKMHGLEGKRIILGVAGTWSKSKGLDDFIKLGNLIDENYKIVLVGLDNTQIKLLPKNILGIPKTASGKELAEIYTAADVFVNMTYEDNFPTVNLEAQACGTRVITYDTGGCKETITTKKSQIVPAGDISAVYQSIINN